MASNLLYDLGVVGYRPCAVEVNSIVSYSRGSTCFMRGFWKIEPAFTGIVGQET